MVVEAVIVVVILVNVVIAVEKTREMVGVM
mgnify:CR=1 FL=1